MQQRDQHRGGSGGSGSSRSSRGEEVRRQAKLSADRRRSARKEGKAVRQGQSLLPAAILFMSIAVVIMVMVHVSGEAELGTTGRGTLVLRPEGAVSTQVADVDRLFTDPYDWSCLRLDERGRYVYERDGKRLSRAGIDVSEHQGDIDWAAVAADGIDFAILRVGFRGAATGNVTEDATFRHNLEAARTAGLDVGVYFYSLATTAEEAREEAEFVVSTLSGAQLEYPVAFDMEPTSDVSDRLHGLDKDTMTEIAQAFCETVSDAGYFTTVYGNQTDLSRYHLMRLADYGFWYAQYGSEPSMSLSFGLWQYTQQGQVNGIEKVVDLDLDLTAVLNE